MTMSYSRSLKGLHILPIQVPSRSSYQIKVSPYQHVSNRSVSALTERPRSPTIKKGDDHGAHDKATTVTVRSALNAGCIDYVRGWAWQQYLLNQRLEKK